jgi:UDP-GlcNAc:undecaprenyl-phosphate/decaprenyl-phosphate GlcNAc-1-phosphate transferase
MLPIGWYAVVLVVAAAVTAALTWPARQLSVRVGYVAAPDERKVHSQATPYGGGAAMFMGFLVAMTVAAVVPGLHSIFNGSSEPLGVVLAAAAIFAVGLIDDVREMSAPAKVAGQVLAASILYFLGVTMYQFKVPLAGFIVLTPGVIPLITALWVIALTNAVNLIDGLDGLAAGVVAIGGGALALYGLRLMDLGLLPRDNVGPLIAVIACGVCLGFLPFNFHPAKVFMGDAGALFLGLLMSASTMVIGGRTPPTSGVTYFFFAPLFIPFFILGVPLVDMAFAFVRRTARGTGFHTPDKDHIHHRLLRLGHGHRRSVLILWAWTALLSGFILFPLFFHQVNAIIPFGVAALGIGLYTLFHPGLRQRDEPPDPAEAGASAGRGAEPVPGPSGAPTVPEGADADAAGEPARGGGATRTTRRGRPAPAHSRDRSGGFAVGRGGMRR